MDNQCYCTKHVWFNTLGRHGGEGPQGQTRSLRIDGKFTEAFRQKLRDKFGDGKHCKDM